MPEDDVCFRRMANTVLVDEEFFEEVGTRDMSRVYQRLTWVGGKVWSTKEHLWFSAGRLNRAVNRRVGIRGRYSQYTHHWEYALEFADITELHLRSWFGFSFVQLHIRSGISMGIRCWGAAGVYREIEQRMSTG